MRCVKECTLLHSAIGIRLRQIERITEISNMSQKYIEIQSYIRYAYYKHLVPSKQVVPSNKRHTWSEYKPGSTQEYYENMTCLYSRFNFQSSCCVCVNVCVCDFPSEFGRVVTSCSPPSSFPGNPICMCMYVRTLWVDEFNIRIVVDCLLRQCPSCEVSSLRPCEDPEIQYEVPHGISRSSGGLCHMSMWQNTSLS